MKYLAIQKMMWEKRWDDALVLLEKVLKKHSCDTDALRLAQVCKIMQEVKKSIEKEVVTEKDKKECNYFSVFFFRILRQLCSFFAVLFSFLPEKWHKNRFSVWTLQLEVKSCPEKDLLWELSFWDSRRNIIVFSVIGAIFIGCIVFFIWISCPHSSEEADWSSIDGKSIVLKAQRGDPNAQYQLGMLFYRGTALFPRDIEQSYSWLSRSAKAGHKDAAAFLQRVIFERENH